MANGKPWGREAEDIMQEYAGRLSAEEIGRMTGHTAATIQRRMQAAGLTAYHPARPLTRREQLLSGAAGLYAPEP